MSIDHKNRPERVDLEWVSYLSAPLSEGELELFTEQSTSTLTETLNQLEAERSIKP